MKRGVGRLIASALAMLLFGTTMVASGGGVVPANAAEGASLLLVKTVDGQDAVRDLRPGDSVTYRVEFRVNDEDADSPVRVTDALPAAFAGWHISGLTAVVGGSPQHVTLDLPGIVAGPSTANPSQGTLGTTVEDLTITVGIEEPVQAGPGNTNGLGMSTRDTGVLEYTLTVPSDLSPLDPILRTDLVNTATFNARAGMTELIAVDTATISVDNPVAVDVTPSKSWSPSGQNFHPGEPSSVTIGATQASNVAASSLQLQDVADPARTPNGAVGLHRDNPFNYVDFAGFTAPADPTTNLPNGATSAIVQVYYFNGSTWNWEVWNDSMTDSDIAGVRTTYAGSIPPGTAVTQGFTVKQRSTDRTSNTSISTGYQISNDIRATVEVPGQSPVSKDAQAPFGVAPDQIDVTAQKRFHMLPDGAETTSLAGVTAGDTVGVVLRAINNPAPQSTTLDRLIIAEPGIGSDSRFFSSDLAFAGFDNRNATAIWPAGATSAELVWIHPGGPTVINIAAGDVLPTAPADVSGFQITFTGAIEPGASAEIRYQLKTSSDEGFVGAGATGGPFRNTIDVTGQKMGLPDETDNAGANISLVAPSINVHIDKRVGPGMVMPGKSVVVQLDTKVETSGGRTKPTEIIVEDASSGPGTFWDAFNATAILPPISRPLNETSATQADLRIEMLGADGSTWTTLATNPDELTPVPVPESATGLRFVYTNADGLSQITYVKPNIAFKARNELRSAPGAPTAGTFTTPELYENLATAEATGKLDDRIVTGKNEDRENVGIRGTEKGTGPGPGGLWVEKNWAHDSLVSQSGATSWTTQNWAVTQDGYVAVHLQDSAAPTTTGAGTVFEAFNLTHIRPILFAGATSNGTVDPSLRWDLVADVQLWDGIAWNSVSAPDGGWMDVNGFKGYTLNTTEQDSALSVRLVVVENAAARQAARETGDLTAPAVGSGVASSAEIRSFRLDWQVRDRARTVDGSLKWVKEADTSFNCDDGSDGCIDNVFGVTAIPVTGGSVSNSANDSIQLLDGTTNVVLTKQVQHLPIDPLASPSPRIELVTPNPGELKQEDYPSARYTLTTANSSTTPTGSRGMMKLGKIRVTDTSTHQIDPAPVFDMEHSPFEGRDFTVEVAGSAGNHFNEFTLIGVRFEALPAYIDSDWSTVELWAYDGTTPEGVIQEFTLRQALEGDPAFLAALPDAIGISVTYSGTDPAVNGNRIVVGDNLAMHLDVQLRQTERLSGDPVQGGAEGAIVSVPNEAISRGWDAVVNPDRMPTDQADAVIELVGAEIRVNLEKQVSVDHGGSMNQTIVETDPGAPVNVLLTADPHEATAPLDTLRIEDNTATFWERFEFAGFGTPMHPTDADLAEFDVYVEGNWVDYSTDIDPTAVRGVAVTFSRTSGNGLFPAGSVSWNSSWGTATLPFVAQLRDGATVDWKGGDREENTATVVAKNAQYGQATDQADDEVTFSPGVHAIRVVKRAPNDMSTHQVDPLVSLPWQLEFTNTGDSYLPIVQVTDALPATLQWDGEQPAFIGTPGANGATGLSSAPQDVSVTRSNDGRQLVFEWPAGSRMEPGETMTIELGLILQPLPTGERATNEVSVETGVALASCTQPTDFGQNPKKPVEASTCSNTNFVQPRVGTVVGAVKTVNGEPGHTLGENLVHGALDVRTGEECGTGNYLPIASDYTRSPCASYTAVGATDNWKLEHINSGTNALSRMTVVDMMPHPGDKMLAGGAPRTSTFTPVLVQAADGEIFTVTGLPSGAVFTVDVTTNPDACVGPVPGNSLWVADPECIDVATNPANSSWIALDTFLLTGNVADIAGFRMSVDMTNEPLQPAGSVVIEFQTVNRVIEHSEEGLQPSLEQYATPQFAWNQNGVIAWDTADNRVHLPAAPQRAGVTIKTSELVISKEVLGDGAGNAPDFFEVELACTVPSGLAEPERVPLDMGVYATVAVPKDGRVTVPDIPIGADCIAKEAGPVGFFGENGRTILEAPGVTPSTDGLRAEILIRENSDGETTLKLRNTYTLGELVIEKVVRSNNGHELSDDQRQLTFSFTLRCVANGLTHPVERSFELGAGAQHREAGLPVGADCTLTETSTRGAVSTTTTIAGEESDGVSRMDIRITDQGGHVLVSNMFDGPPPALLEKTGASAMTAPVLTIALLLLLLGAAAVYSRNRRSAPDAN